MGLSLRQKVLKLVYPLLIWGRKKSTHQKRVYNKRMTPPPVSFYALSAMLNDGKQLPFEKLKGKKILLVNTASNCGYTPQYAELQKLYQHSKDHLEIIAFPANDFKEQEKGSDEDIASFCSKNYGVSFPVAKKIVTVKNEKQHPVFQWLSDKEKNGWNDKVPEWNFSKYLLNEKGMLTHYFSPQVSPLSEEVLASINQ